MSEPARDPFEQHLRRVLGAGAEAAPMPAGVADRHLEGARRAWTLSPPLIGGVFASLVAVLAIGFAALNVPSVGSLLGLPVSREAAGALVGVPVSQVAESSDGAIAFEVSPGANPIMSIHLVRHGEESLQTTLLARFEVAPELFDDTSSTVWGNNLSCSEATGLRQPNFIVGGAYPEPEYLGVGSSSATAHNGRFFLSVLEPSILEESVVASLGNASFTTPPDAFERSDACRGEVIGEH